MGAHNQAARCRYICITRGWRATNAPSVIYKRCIRVSLRSHKIHGCCKCTAVKPCDQTSKWRNSTSSRNTIWCWTECGYKWLSSNCCPVKCRRYRWQVWCRKFIAYSKCKVVCSRANNNIWELQSKPWCKRISIACSLNSPNFPILLQRCNYSCVVKRDNCDSPACRDIANGRESRSLAKEQLYNQPFLQSWLAL